MTIYIVRKNSTSDKPEDKGQELRRFKTWEEAQKYSTKGTYISIER